jgi:hypothetical protein
MLNDPGWRADPTKTFYFGLALGGGLTFLVIPALLFMFGYLGGQQ